MNIQATLSEFRATGISLNAQTIQKGELFVALQGSESHGIDFIDEAINRGCVAVLVEGINWSGSIPNKNINKLKQYLPLLADYFYPKAKHKAIIGITGTNGKTSVACFISQLLDGLGKSNTVIGTLSGERTTPDIFTLYKMLNQCNDELIVLEVSSHALAQGRVLGLNFKQAIFTNLTQDHLDYHQTMAAYLAEKTKLFTFDSLENVIVNQDDGNYQYFLGNNPVLYSKTDFASVIFKEFGFLLQLDKFVFELNLLGEFNLYNLLAAFHSVCALGFEKEVVIPLLSKLQPPIGRMQKIKNKLVWVDYAHTHDALKNAINSLQMHYPDNKIRVLFGCGGNRDKDKRAQMGKIASTLADSLILTNDNPRNENPQDIIDDILSGIDDSFKLDIILDRQLAIATAITTLATDECLLIAGKGHESSQIFKHQTLDLNDLEIAKNTVV